MAEDCDSGCEAPCILPCPGCSPRPGSQSQLLLEHESDNTWWRTWGLRSEVLGPWDTGEESPTSKQLLSPSAKTVVSRKGNRTGLSFPLWGIWPELRPTLKFCLWHLLALQLRESYLTSQSALAHKIGIKHITWLVVKVK